MSSWSVETNDEYQEAFEEALDDIGGIESLYTMSEDLEDAAVTLVTTAYALRPDLIPDIEFMTAETVDQAQVFLLDSGY